ncbi:MAG: catalase/peroxidase HPI [Phycisphaerae bacterium]|nr:catalase/peroxidase HPI [Phycisphaerae bacterium]MDG1899908.1 catalase/peroxidase HPI [Phycisphaerales bacterium]
MSSNTGKCPVLNHSLRSTVESPSNQQWWPNQLDLRILDQNSPRSNPMGERFDYPAHFAKVDLGELKQDILEMMTTSQDWWPADYGHYGPFFIRMAWHSAGTYRIQDGRGGASTGTLRFAPLNSWPDNVNLDKARRLLWPIKRKYGRSVSWADLMIFTGNCAIESMGLETVGFAGGREDVWAPEEDVDWGPETQWLGDERYSGDRELANPLGAVQMGLIYVNPEGPNGTPDPSAAAVDIRETFRRMAMNDEETVALIAGGHTFGKAHGAADPDEYVGREPEGAGIEEQGLGWRNSFGSGNAADTISSGLEGAWTTKPTTWDNNYFDNLFGYEWELTSSPAGAAQWTPKGGDGAGTVPDAHDTDRTHAPIMFTTDLALRIDPIYAPIAKRFHEHPEELAAAFARAWFKLTHRDMGPVSRYLGTLVPDEQQTWQDPIPVMEHEPIGERDIAELKKSLLACGVSIGRLVNTAWASASTFRGTDHRGGANGGRIRLAPQRDWKVNDPRELESTLQAIEAIRRDFNADRSDGKLVSVADLVVLGGCAAIEQAARSAGHEIEVPFTPGRTDALQEQTDVESFAVLEPATDGFRNHMAADETRPAAALLVDRAQRLTLSAPEMTVLLGGLRVLDANTGTSQVGVFTSRPESLTTDFFVNLLDSDTTWGVSPNCEHVFEGRDRISGDLRWTGSSVDLAFGSNSQLRAISEVYACEDSDAAFIHDFIAAWNKVMNLDRFD